ncbi:hypothetical protein SA2016_0833 [Sinomonas atrocyanea]|uniref:Uncharacterized protein n=1 Tax=Sinomonas atrocyanea TaxID=37927 RepID=A0A126ZY66_9MICC|nr:hypothetical protein [Sinomonas atrocyanea]AMM31521.1 hypothetical protein SA2016_0833 [Sinomonas atrocyanea]GEB65087.1 hypothetical protein SAT01_25350 [Sinomonas atrocyanea]GGG63348.1 hypothetical protein GCM10007172_13240 [Sinomonas atrocyanea]
MSGKHTTPAAGAEPTAWTPEDLHEAHRLSQAVLQWESQRRATLEEIARRPRLSFEEAVECHDTDGSAYILPWQLSEHRIARMVEAATLILGPTEDELRTAVQAVTEAVSEAAARAVAEAHPDAAVQAEHALWGTPALRYDGADQEQAALYGRGIPSDHLLEGALAYTPGAFIAAASIRAQRTAAAQNPEPARLDEEKTSALPSPTAEPELTAADIAQIRALQAASFPTSPGTHQPPTRTGTAAGTDPATTRTPNAATARGHGR